LFSLDYHLYPSHSTFRHVVGADHTDSRCTLST